MNPLLLILIEAGFKIGASHMGSGGGTVIKTADFILDAARALDDLYKEETGQPLDWSKIRIHEHLPPAGSEPTLPGISETDEGPAGEPELDDRIDESTEAPNSEDTTAADPLANGE